MATAVLPMERVDRGTGEVLDLPVPAPRAPAFLVVGEPQALARLFAKMASILADIGRVAKLGENTQQHYRYATAADLLDEVRPLLAKHGVAFFPTVVASEQRRDGKKVTTRIELQTAYCCAETGAMLVSTWHGEADDWGDKSYWKAYTGTLKYALFQTFLVSTGDDPEEDAAGGEATAEAQPAPAKAPAKKSAPAAKPERTEWHTRMLGVINERRKLLPDGYACTVGKTQTGDLKAFVVEHWALISENIDLAKKAAHAIDAALKEVNKQKRAEAKARPAETPEEQLERLRGRYFALIAEKHGDVHDADRRAFQEKVTEKASTTEWTAKEYEAAIGAVQAGRLEEFICPL